MKIYGVLSILNKIFKFHPPNVFFVRFYTATASELWGVAEIFYYFFLQLERVKNISPSVGYYNDIAMPSYMNRKDRKLVQKDVTKTLLLH